MMEEQEEVVTKESKRNLEDDWFLMLEAVPKELSDTPQGSSLTAESVAPAYISCMCSAFIISKNMKLFSSSAAVSDTRLEGRPASFVKVGATEQLQDTLEEEAATKPPVIEKEQQDVVVLQSERSREGDGFPLLDETTREPSSAPPGADFMTSRVHFVCRSLLKHLF